MKQILLPIDGSERSLKAITWVQENYQPEDIEVTIVMVTDSLSQLNIKQNHTSATEHMMNMMNKYASSLIEKGYTVHQEPLFGDAGEQVVEFAKEHDVDAIVMTKSTKHNWLDTIGSVTTYVVKYSPVLVMIIPEVGK